MPTMVPTKTARRCQALAVTPMGAGMHQMMRPARTENPSGFSFAPFHAAGAASAACTTGAGTALARTTLAREAREARGALALRMRSAAEEDAPPLKNDAPFERDTGADEALRAPLEVLLAGARTADAATGAAAAIANDMVIGFYVRSPTGRCERSSPLRVVGDCGLLALVFYW